MRGSPENENTKIRNSLTNVHERSRCVCLSMTVLACASGIVRPRDVAKTAHGCRGYGNMASQSVITPELARPTAPTITQTLLVLVRAREQDS